MKPGNSSCLVQIYHYLLRLYPAEFLAEFGQEMEAVFSEAITEAHEKGFGSVLILFLRELRDLPSSLWRELRRRRQDHKQTFALANGIDGPGQWQPATVLETVVTILPFVLSGLLFFYEALVYAGITSGIMSYWGLRLYLVALAGFGVGWVKGFPRWSLGYVGLALVLSWGGVPPDLATSRLRLFDTTIVLNEFWGWRSLLAVVLMATLFCRSLDPLTGLAKSIWRDWSRLSFIFYGALAWLTLAIVYDGKTWYDQVDKLPVDIFKSALIFVIGVLFYLRLRSPMQRALALLGAFSLPWLINVAIGAIIDGRVDVGWQGLVIWSVPILLPGLLGIMRRAGKSPGLT